ncbi:MAG: TIGR03435 family protein [Edaphobacter sp.]
MNKLFSLLAIAFLVAQSAPMDGQILHATEPQPSFAVASIRPSQPDDVFLRREFRADSLTIKAMTLKQIISYAYGITFDRELAGGPGWVREDKFDIQAKPDETKVAALSKLSHDDLDEQMRLMVQSLLAERFHLAVSFPKKELTVFTLVIAKGGLRCTKVEAKTPLAATPPPRFDWLAPPPPPPPPRGYIPPTPEEKRTLTQTMHMRTPYWPFWLVVAAIGHEPELEGRPVIDKTGLEGSYDCEVSWSRADSDGPGSSFFTAIQDQMGLKLKPSKESVEILLIDHIERPSEN